MSVPVEVDDAGLRHLLTTSERPVVVDFYSPDCVACRGVAIHMGLLADRHSDAIVVALLDTSAHREVAAEHNVRGVPSVLVFVAGEVVAEGFGLYGVDHWSSLVTPYLRSRMPQLSAPTAKDWGAMQSALAISMADVFRGVLAEPPTVTLAEELVVGGVRNLASNRDAMRSAVATYIDQPDLLAFWPVVVDTTKSTLDGLARSLAVVAVLRAERPDLAGGLLGAVDGVCPVWGRLIRNMAGGLMYVVQENEDPKILRQFVMQACGISGIRPTPLDDGTLRVDASPEPADKLALFFGV